MDLELLRRAREKEGVDPLPLGGWEKAPLLPGVLVVPLVVAPLLLASGEDGGPVGTIVKDAEVD